MGFGAKVLADSISPAGHRLTTLEVTIPRIVLAEFNTHRMLSRNSASSRAIPVEKRIEAVQADPFIPEAFGKNTKGMQAIVGDLEGEDAEQARVAWLRSMEAAVAYAQQLAKLGVHKQLANRLLEPFSWHTIIVTTTEWSNFWGLRISPDAQPEIRTGAELMKAAMDASEPRKIGLGGWHLPLVPDVAELERGGYDTMSLICKISVARCARVSFLTHDGKRDPAADVVLYERLVKSGHMSPLEHVATPDANSATWDALCYGNFRGWKQLRKTVPNEEDFSLRATS